MSGIGGVPFSPGWFYTLVMIAQRIMPDVRRRHPELTDAWLLAHSLSEAHKMKDAGRNEQSTSAENKPSRIAIEQEAKP